MIKAGDQIRIIPRFRMEIVPTAMSGTVPVTVLMKVPSIAAKTIFCCQTLLNR